MQKFTTLTSQVIPLPLNDVDTDMIIPAQYLTRTDVEDYGQFVFERLRQNDANFPFNLDKYQNAQVLVAKDNFGCGSSREHAVWALVDWGIRVILASDFADIFYSNAAKNGLVLVKLPPETIEEIISYAQEQNYQVTVSLEEQKVILPDKRELYFDFDPFRKECILNGYDDLDYILAHDKAIDQWDQKREQEIFINRSQTE
jgi:3-isopropylmalate/(R)-2-methylmalate dehydratase small subunit